MPTTCTGATLDVSPTGQVSGGLGIATSSGALGLLAPTVDITETGQEQTVDGVRILFQITPGTEAPAEMNFHFAEPAATLVTFLAGRDPPATVVAPAGGRPLHLTHRAIRGPECIWTT